MLEPTPEDILLINNLEILFAKNQTKLAGLLRQVEAMFESEMEEGGRLCEYIHSTKGRIKDAGDLRAKLARKLEDGRKEGKPYGVTEENFFTTVNDLVGYRMMHLHPRQMAEIHPVIMDILAGQKWVLNEKPDARVWDLETEKFYRETVGLDIVPTPDKLYTSVHYVIRPNWTTPLTCEIQVRTLADELWGEVDHDINYPVRLKSVACREQIKSLAHLTTSCSRLVDSIYASHEEWNTLLRHSSPDAVTDQNKA